MRGRMKTGALLTILLAAVASLPDLAISHNERVAIELIDENGSVVRLDDYAQYRRLVFFGFAHCAHICPMTLANTGRALDALGEDADRVRVLFVSVDPKRDTPAVLKAYTDRFHASIVGLTGSYEAIEALAQSYGISFGYSYQADGKTRPIDRGEYESLDASAHYVPFHGTQTLILDRHTEVIDLIGYGSTPETIAGTVAAHLGGDADARAIREE